MLEKETLKFFISTNTFFALSYYLNDNPLLFLEIDFFDRDHEISQFFHFQFSDFFKDTIEKPLIKL